MKKVELGQMKKAFFAILLISMPLLLAAQKPIKKVAILETVDKEGNINHAIKLMLRANLSKAITNTSGYEAYDRTDIDAIMGEQNFQRTGMVSDDQIKKLGEMTGASYILVAEAAKVDAQNLFITAKILNVETAKTEMTDNVLSTATPADIQHACESLANKLLGIKTDVLSTANPSPQLMAQKTNEGPLRNRVNDVAGHFRNKVNDVAEIFRKEKAESSNDYVPREGIGELITFKDGSRGIVFYLDDEGHGLVVSVDQTSVLWEDGKGRKQHDISEILNEDDCNTEMWVGLGENNTNAISRCYDGVFPAANWCRAHGSGWYLPSAGELYYLLKVANQGKGSKGYISNVLKSFKFPPLDGWYWSSSEIDKNEAWNLSDGGRTSSEDKNEKGILVRAVRYF